MSAIPEPWQGWFAQLAEILTEFEKLAREHDATINLSPPSEVLASENAPTITAEDEWLQFMERSLQRSQVAGARPRFDFFPWLMRHDLIGFLSTAAPLREFPIDRLTAAYVGLMRLFEELRCLSPEMAQSFAVMSPSTLIQGLPSKGLLQDLLMFVGNSVSLARPQAILALELGYPTAAGDEWMKLIDEGLQFHAASLSRPLGLAWDAYIDALGAEDQLIQRQASNHSMDILHLDSAVLEQMLVWSYLEDDQLPEAISILIHLLRKHQHDRECEQDLEVGTEDWAKWLAESIGQLATRGEAAHPLLIDIAGFADMSSLVAADREEGHRLRVRDRMGGLWDDLHLATRMRLEKSEKEHAQALKSSADPATMGFHLGLFAEDIYAAIENETKQRLSSIDQLTTLPSNIPKLSVSLQKITVQGFIDDAGGDAMELKQLLGNPLIEWLRRCRNSSLHKGNAQVNLEDANATYDAMWGLQAEGTGWLRRYFSSLPPSSPAVAT